MIIFMNNKLRKGHYEPEGCPDGGLEQHWPPLFQIRFSAPKHNPYYSQLQRRGGSSVKDIYYEMFYVVIVFVHTLDNNRILYYCCSELYGENVTFWISGVEKITCRLISNQSAVQLQHGFPPSAAKQIANKTFCLMKMKIQKQFLE